MHVADLPKKKGLLGDTAERDYAAKLRRFNAFAEAELRSAIDALNLRPGTRVLDAGCGSGESLRYFHEAVGASGAVVGFDLAAAHAMSARTVAPPRALVLQADLLRAPLRAASFDLVWCVNTINHFAAPLAAVERLASLLRTQGRLVLCQSSLLPDMYFAWNSQLERRATAAVHQYYRDRYGVSEEGLTAIRALVGLLRRSKFRNVWSKTFTIERISPLTPADEDYLYEIILRDLSSERLRPYLSDEDYEELIKTCDPHRREFALKRPDFHFLQTFTMVGGEVYT